MTNALAEALEVAAFDCCSACWRIELDEKGRCVCASMEPPPPPPLLPPLPLPLPPPRPGVLQRGILEEDWLLPLLPLLLPLLVLLLLLLLLAL